ncbi:MAG TPA: hypothetical protein VM431_04895 [Phycisphaerae bacterium]|nr:hypothetical protein [Phycisphaerae bacterium]
MRRAVIAVALIAMLVGLAWVSPCRAAAPLAVVRKVAETFDEAPWPVDRWSRAAGASRVVDERPPDVPGGKALEFEARFSGGGFEHLAVMPREPLVVPGRLRTVTVRAQRTDARYPLVLTFKDGWGRSQVGPTKLEVSLAKGDATGWQTTTFRVPDDWVQPLTIAGFQTHNWSAQDAKNVVRFRVDHLEVETDLADVDPATGALKTWQPEPNPADPKKALAACPAAPLVSVAFSTGEVSNVFSRTEPAVTVSLRNWRAAALGGRLTCRVLDAAGGETGREERDVSVDAPVVLRVPLAAPRFGLYTLEAALVLADGTRRTERMAFARIPPEKDLSAARKRASPYGLNVHGGSDKHVIDPFRKAGIVWFRDYAFSYEWMLRAKGKDRRYDGWPWYPALVNRYTDAGVMLLPCLMKSIGPPKIEGGKAAGPDRAWVREIADIVLAFPQITYWELDNEYDLPKEHADAEDAIGWASYRAYHRRFAEVLDVLGAGDLVAVEQGRAGIWAERIRACVESGDFAKVGVVNTHHYCGTEPPETNFGNWNVPFTGDYRSQPPRLFFDALRDTKRAATADGRPRESWLTEFGWDNLAGPVVSLEQQAAYLARGWMVALAAGTDKCFWFFDYDAPAPKQIFDGMGLLAADGSPKLVLCAAAGLTSVLPNPRYVGGIEAGPGTAGYVFEQDGRLVAAFWTIGAGDGPKVAFKAEQLRDYLGNPLPGKTARLAMAPVYAVGLEKGDPLYAQTAYELATPHLVLATSGDTIPLTIEVRNNRDADLACTVRVTSPEGWTSEVPQAPVAVAKGQTQKVPLTVTVAPGEVLGRKECVITVLEGEKPVKAIPLTVLVEPALAMHVTSLAGAPGKAAVTVKIANRSSRPVGGTLRLALPAAWKAEARETAVPPIPGGQTRAIECALVWNGDWKADESARVEFDAGGGLKVSQPIIPPHLGLARA